MVDRFAQDVGSLVNAISNFIRRALVIGGLVAQDSFQGHRILAHVDLIADEDKKLVQAGSQTEEQGIVPALNLQRYAVHKLVHVFVHIVAVDEERVLGERVWNLSARLRIGVVHAVLEAGVLAQLGNLILDRLLIVAVGQKRLVN